MKNIILIGLTIVSTALTTVFVRTFISRLSMPYNSQGRYFDGESMVVYHEQAKLVYGLISIGFVILTGILAKFSFGKRK